MPTEAPGEDRVHRLIDMVVEEVSLVDRAANLRRFLVVKRDPSMAKPAPKKTPKKPPVPPAPGKEAPPPKPAKKAAGEVLSVATDALEALTAAVERLGEASDEEASTLVETLIEDLNELAARLAETAGLASDEETEKREGSSLEDVRSLLGKVRELLDEASKAQDESAPQDEPSTTPASDEAAERVSSQLSQIGEDLKSLTSAVREQGQRLGRLEKGVGLPNSRSAPERPTARSDEDEESWPLDLNRPHNRNDNPAQGR
ncbi:MAG: hypothetical protein MUF64_23385 [Polyangiaceae bacterium]|jgi:hypothetical protein|nr:hypothetical protein [Polyangiaceae bacterium]